MHSAKPSNGHQHIRKRRRTGRLSGRTRFRAIVRMVLHHRPWLIDRAHVDKNIDEDIKKNVLQIEVMTKEKYQDLSIQNKSLLRKDQRLRTREEVDTLYKVIGNLECFRRYPENVRKELVASTYFEYCGGGRVVVRQDHAATFLGFVLRGELQETHSKLDPVFGVTVTEVAGLLGPGAVFGEVSLLHNVPRTATITSITAVELLILKKDDFDRVLKASMQKQWDEISSAMKQFPYFESWDDVATRECCMLSDTFTCNVHDIVLGKGVGKNGSAHFVLSGTCSMVQRLMVRRQGDQYKLHPPDNSSSGAEPLVMQVCHFTQGGCFNLGESLTERTIVAETNVRVLRIPLYLLRQHNVANIWSRIRQFLESRMLSDQELFQEFLDARRWDKYKKKICAQMRNHSILNDTSIHDAPYFCRVMDTELCEDKICNSEYGSTHKSSTRPTKTKLGAKPGSNRKF